MGCPASIDGRAWYALRIKRHRERLTARYLEHDGFPTYLPLLLQRPRPAVGSEVVPLFPGYLFVALARPHDFSDLRFVPGVLGFVSRADGPIQVDDAVISVLRSRQGPDGIVHPAPLPAGGAVRIVAGPFKDLVAVVDGHHPTRERVRILLHVLQRQTRVELPERWVRRA